MHNFLEYCIACKPTYPSRKVRFSAYLGVLTVYAPSFYCRNFVVSSSWENTLNRVFKTFILRYNDVLKVVKVSAGINQMQDFVSFFPYNL